MSDALSLRRDVAAGWRLVDALVWAFRALRLRRLGRVGGYALLIPGVLVVGVLAASLVRLAWMSLHDFDPYLYTQGGWTTANFREVIESAYYRNIMLRTLGLSAGVTVVALLAALPFAYTMVRTGAGGRGSHSSWSSSCRSSSARSCARTGGS